MRIGLVCPYSLDVPGGVQRHVLDLAEALRERGHDAQVLAPGRHSPAEHVTVVGPGLPVRYNGATSRVRFDPVAAHRAGRWLRHGEYDVIHIHEPTAPSLGRHVMARTRAPLVATFHMAHAVPGVIAGPGRLLSPKLGRLRAEIAVSGEARRTAERSWFRDPQVIPNGVHVGRFRGAPPIASLARDGGTLAFVGRFEDPRKGFAVLIEAMRRLPGVRLLVVGPGTPLSAPGLDVRFLGQLPDDELASVLATADVVVAPNVGGESFGMVVVEAMAAGACLVASDLPAFAEVTAGEGATLVPRGDVTALATSLDHLLRHPAERQRWGESAASVAADYDWSHVVPQIEAVYESVVAGAVFAPTTSDS